MQKNIETNVHLRETVLPFESIGKLDAIDKTALRTMRAKTLKKLRDSHC